MKKQMLFICAILATIFTTCKKNDGTTSDTTPTIPTTTPTTPTITTLASGIVNAVDIAVDANSVYWTEYGDTAFVKKVGVYGGNVTILAVQPRAVTLSMAINQNSVFWTQGNHPIGAISTSPLMSVGINGGTVKTLVSNYTARVSVSSTNVYYTTGFGGKSDMVNKIGVNGGNAIALAAGLQDPSCITVDATSVYWTSSWTGLITKTGINGGTITTLASMGSGGNSPIVVDATSLYFITFPTLNKGAINKVGLNGGTVTTLATSNIPICLVVDSTDVYWGDEAGYIYKVSKNGGTVTSLPVLSYPSEITVDSHNIYWTDIGAVRKVPKW